ncbi:hypothetical protein MKX01_020784 [Papaver californicum]|nr:hypothetical protein MKX01_020784 [Papaver californicum]
MRKDYGIDITYRKAYVGCKREIESVRGSPDDSYQYLVGYTLGVCLDGFKTCCRHTFVVDSMHLSRPCKVLLLSIIGYDDNEKMYPIAFVIVDSENGDSCEWFMQKLFDALGPEYSLREDLVVCSDRSKSIEEAVVKVFPRYVMYTAHTILKNIMKKYHNATATEAFMRAAKVYNDDDYRKAISEVKKDKEVLSYVHKVSSRFWARIHAKSHRFTLMTTNICESWNAYF